MAKLILSIEGAILKEIPLTKQRTTIGRKPQNDIQIDNLAISGEHAVLITVGNDSFLEDINSTNGTYVNGQQIKKHFLQNGDTIELGKYSLKYVGESAYSAQEEDFEKTTILRPGSLVPPPPSPMAASIASPSAHWATSDPMKGSPVSALPLGAIQILTGGNVGKELELAKTLTTLGKPGVQVAAIARRPHGYFITHVEGENSPVVNGVMIGRHACQLNDHDIVELAGIKLEFFLKG